MKYMSADPKGVPMKTMLEGLEQKSGFTDADEISHHDKRIHFMDKHDVEMQVLSYGNGAPSNLEGQRAIDLCKKANDTLAEYIEKYPDRFVGFATLPINEPEATVEEFKRCINDLGFKGALIMGHPKNGFLDQDAYEPLFAAAEALNAPIYLHPSPVQSDVYQAYYKGNYPDVTAATFACFGYGWHVDVGIHAIHLVLSGVFDRHPNLNIIIGHWGEFVPFFLERMDSILFADHLQHSISHYFKNNFYITPSGMLTKPQFDLVKAEVGIDRILYSADYPYVEPEQLGTFLSELGLTEEEQEKISYANGAKLLGLDK
ncbi:amidohydrolase family protein [Staphylococcus borealis]|uniref:Amidohydrolase n=2 Tax=Staphylococcus TaxID=1279 RepID=A0ABX2LGU3_9STAP|nr:amidohydrolase family protein [Staphylococcus borealis]MUN93754.1 amidohydrolase family protein [Staphylococcus borealis]NUI79026.1 amidohydrolase [Staphylococcus borealis]NUI81538.1 amidohydrolase [Staphylococcus borealis]NUI83986.1 amidohydrolase [Staphylococcus borealis]NUI90953.1 amidohydrolase [Staphylococcus borealis]